MKDNNNKKNMNDFLNDLIGDFFGEMKKENPCCGDTESKQATDEIELAAIQLKRFFDAFMKAGFTTEQTIAIIAALSKGTK